MRFEKRTVLVMLALFCLFRSGFGAEPQQQVTVLKYVVPVYPPIARTARVTGDMVLSFKVQGDGTVADINVVSGPKMFAQTCLDAIRQWKFQCLSCVYGKPFQHQFTFSFRIDGKLGERDHSIKYDLPDKLTLSVGAFLVETESQVSAASE